jgi:SAM-dependent methyltransferase
VLQGDRIQHFGESLRLYFHSFEFNGGLYYLLRWILGDFGHWANRVLPWLMAGWILASAWRERSRGWTGLPAAMMLALTIYQLHSPVLHPWYVTPVVAMAALGPYRYPVLWSLLLPFTYASYFHADGVHEPAWQLVLEYVPLFGFMAYEWISRRQRATLTEFILRSPLLRRLAQRSIPARLAIKLERIARHLGSGDRILDIGTGNGGLCLALRNKGLDIMPLDVVNLSFFPDVVPVIYDGTRIPFADKSYDTSLLVTMLHHTPNPEAVIREAIRVTRGKLVIMEDIYRNNLQRRLTFFADSLVNLEFEGHPHTNLNDGQWKALFDRLDLKLVYGEEFRTLIFFRQVVYVLEIPSGTRGTASNPGRVME